MEITIYIAIYVLGCVLAYGRLNASSIGQVHYFFFIMILFSWFWLFAGTVSWLNCERHYNVKYLKF